MIETAVMERKFVLEGVDNYDGSKENVFITFSTKREKLPVSDVVLRHVFKRIILDREFDVPMSFKYYEKSDKSYVLKIDSRKLVDEVAEKTGLKHENDVNLLVAKAMVDIAEGFCHHNNLKVALKNSYYPVLEYLVEEVLVLK